MSTTWTSWSLILGDESVDSEWGCQRWGETPTGGEDCDGFGLPEGWDPTDWVGDPPAEDEPWVGDLDPEGEGACCHAAWEITEDEYAKLEEQGI